MEKFEQNKRKWGKNRSQQNMDDTTLHIHYCNLNVSRQWTYVILKHVCFVLLGHSLTWAQKHILLSQIVKVVESNFDQGCLSELTFIFLNIYTAVVDT